MATNRLRGAEDIILHSSVRYFNVDVDVCRLIGFESPMFRADVLDLLIAQGADPVLPQAAIQPERETIRIRNPEPPQPDSSVTFKQCLAPTRTATSFLCWDQVSSATDALYGCVEQLSRCRHL